MLFVPSFTFSKHSLTFLGRPPTTRLEALSQRLGQSTFLDYAAMRPGATPGAIAAAAPGPGPLAALRLQMGLPSVPGTTPVPPHRGAGWHLSGLATLGKELLGGDGGSGGAATDAGSTLAAELGVEVLVSAARQRLMAASADELCIGELELLAADYASLAGMELEHRALDRSVHGSVCSFR